MTGVNRTTVWRRLQHIFSGATKVCIRPPHHKPVPLGGCVAGRCKLKSLEQESMPNKCEIDDLQILAPPFTKMNED